MTPVKTKTSAEQLGSLDITPSPRVLRMLGQIEFEPWQCLAELIDNSIDAFLDSRAGRKRRVLSPKVEVDVPAERGLENASMAAVVVRDNGPGMSEAELQKAIKAGYSGNDPVEKLGLFGMGFNIATARLGRRTVVETTTADSDFWSVVEIDFDVLERAGSFAAPLGRRAKTPAELQEGVHGTQISVSKLEPERIRPLIKGRGKALTRTKLGKVYGKVMRDLGMTLLYDGEALKARRHCVWDERRTVPNESFGNISAVQAIEIKLEDRRFCTSCWVWLEPTDRSCPACGLAEATILRSRSIKGWLGIQRYFDKSHYGIDLIRNGRVIQELDKSLFEWQDPETLEKELEYPLDATHWGGRIVGELEIDFVRVSHQKDSFDKHDPEWRRVVEEVRGTSPMRPNIAKHRNLPINKSPLAKLFAGFRRGDVGLRSLVPGYPGTPEKGNNGKEVAIDWVEAFHRGDPDYQTDEKWYALVKDAEKQARGGNSRKARQAAGNLPIPEPRVEVANGSAVKQPDPPPAPALEPAAYLASTYQLPALPGAPTLVVRALKGPVGDQWPARFEPSGNTVTFLFDPEHEVFESSLLTPIDLLVSELAYAMLMRSGMPQNEWPLGRVEAELRKAYFPDTLTLVEQAVAEGRDVLTALQEHLEGRWAEGDVTTALPADLQATVAGRLIQAELLNKKDVALAIKSGRFVRYVDRAVVPLLAGMRPEIVLDGAFFAVSYSGVDEQYRADTAAMVLEALKDVSWLVSDVGGAALNKDRAWRLRYGRALASLRLVQSWRP
jgi:hypothetical protein